MLLFAFSRGHWDSGTGVCFRNFPREDLVSGTVLHPTLDFSSILDRLVFSGFVWVAPFGENR